MKLPTALNELSPVDYSVTPARLVASQRYVLLVPRTDADGNDVAGVRVPDVDVPLATYTGFGLRKAGFAEGQLCGLDGSFLPLSRDAQERSARRDPRPSIPERYPTREIYVERVRVSAEQLRSDGLMLDEDVTRVINSASKESRIQALAQ
ncbi:alpha/beta hydrolase domain-containing protein [Variovorax sp. J22R133]|uniref:alpha/beta hydrolase domain-containing protein n=1 Tax=Variovorax brevis TaxID=3053503 RepID=UPI00257715AF|nr:alpha/beta hydrolase domain-containing protein [Variovorax sp. J22R133]MDM0117797.1 alpha/beta hydrolase domain-containing protein [Variovorax sp. J22R133]